MTFGKVPEKKEDIKEHTDKGNKMCGPLQKDSSRPIGGIA